MPQPKVVTVAVYTPPVVIGKDEVVDVPALHAYVPVLPDKVNVSVEPAHNVKDGVFMVNVGVDAMLTTILCVDVPQAFVEPTV